MALDLLLAASILNFIIIVGTFIYAFLNPKEWNEWLVSSYRTYISIYLWTGFVFLIFIILSPIPFTWPLLLLLLVILIWNAKLAYDVAGSRTILPLLLFIASLIWIPYSILNNTNPSEALIYYAITYALGALLLRPIGILISKPLEKFAPKENQKHIQMIKKRYWDKTFGITSLEMLLPERSLFPIEISPSRMVGTGIAYCIWMLLMMLLGLHFGFTTFL
jgi:hypothetical protein